MEKSYIIPESKLRELILCQITLTALNAGGVDNWSWYGDSIKDYVSKFSDDEDFWLEDIAEEKLKEYL